MCFTSTIAGLDLREIGLERVLFGCESIASPCGACSRNPRVASAPALGGDALAAAADRRLPGQAGGLDRTARSSWHVVGGCLAGHSHGSGPEYHRRDESALDL